MSCPDENILVAFATAKASDDTRTLIIAHLDGCPTCRRLVAVLARGRRAPSSATTEPVASERSLKVASELLTVGTIVDQQFRLETFLGSGATSQVWGALNSAGRRVALKFMRGDVPAVKQRMIREAEVAARLIHPSIVRVHSIHESKHGLYLVLDWVEGISLERHLASGPLAVRVALNLIADLADALAFAHQNGIVHRDLKPANLMVKELDQQRLSVTLLDLGVAKSIADGGTKLTATGASVGTPHFMAPEQLFGETQIDGRADVWSLGVILFTVLTGASPIEGSRVGEVYRAVVRQQKADLGATMPTLAPEIAALYRAMTQFDRNQRLADLRFAASVLRQHAK